MANNTRKGKAQTPTKTMDTYNRIRRNFIRQIKNMEQRGYRNLPNVKKIPTALEIVARTGNRNLTTAIKELQRQVETVYEKATAWSEELDMEISGTQKRREERSESGKKGAQTKKENKRKQKDKDFQDEYETSKESTKSYNMLYGFMDLIAQFKPTHPHLAGMLDVALSERLANEDVDDVADDLADIPQQVLADAIDMFTRYKDDAPDLHDFVVYLLPLIKGRPLTAREYKDIEKAVELEETIEEY